MIYPPDSENELNTYVRKKTSVSRPSECLQSRKGGLYEHIKLIKNDKWYYQNCGKCNADGTFLHVDPDCNRCSGTGEHWDKGENARERLRSVYGVEPKSGMPPKFNKFGRRVFTSVEESEAYHAAEEAEEYDRKNRENIWSSFERATDIQPLVENKKECAITSMFLTSEAIAKVIEATYTRVAPSMKNAFSNMENKRIANAVAVSYSKSFPDYYKEEMMIRFIFDKKLALGGMFSYFLYGINKDVTVKPFREMPEMEHIEYSVLRLLPETIKNLLLVFKWRCGGEIKNPPLIYCCESHGFLEVDDVSPLFFDQCASEEGVGRLMRAMFKRNINDFFE